MRLCFSNIILLLFLTLITDIALGQIQYEVRLTIDTVCLCNDSLNSKPEGKFGIYAYVPTPRNSGNYTDTLIRELEQKKEQTIILEQGNYKFIYSPSDSLEGENQYYFNLNPYETQIDLNCFFFNKRYSPLLNQMRKRDTIVITSTYFGPTNDATFRPTHTLVIFRKQKKYYASYFRIEQIGPPIPIINSLYIPKYETQILLTEEQIEKIKEFENNFLKLSINDNLNYDVSAKNKIWFKGKNISFYSREYVSLLLWNELNKTTSNKK